MKQFFVAGGTCDTGERVVAGLCEKYGCDAVTCLVRKTSDRSGIQKLGVQCVEGDVTALSSVDYSFSEQTVYVDITGPAKYWQTVPQLRQLGISRARFVSTTGIYSRYRAVTTEYLQSENAIRESGIAYTIIRPSMIYGTEKDRNMTKLLRFLNRWPVFPIFGRGDNLMQPIYVQDLADGILASIFQEELSRNKEYNLCGPFSLTYRELLRCCLNALNRKVRLIHIPQSLAEMAAAIGEKIPGFPITKEQVMRLSEDKCFDIQLAVKELGFSPRPFAEGVRLEVETLRRRKVS